MTGSTLQANGARLPGMGEDSESMMEETLSGKRITVVVTWMDGQREVCRCGALRVTDGILYLIQDRYPVSDDPARAFPVSNIRTWTVDDPS